MIEAAILATRIEFLEAQHIRDEFQRLSTLVEKTGGRAEHGTFEFLNQFVREALALKERGGPTGR